MKQTVYPYRLHPFFGIPMGVFAIGGCWLCCRVLDAGDFPFAIGWLVFVAACFLLGKHLMDTAKYHADFSGEGITLVQGKKAAPVFVPWSEICFACHGKSRKGHPYLLLSPAPLAETQANALAQKSAVTTRLYIDGSVVIFLQQLKDPTAPEALLPSHLIVQDFT